MNLQGPNIAKESGAMPPSQRLYHGVFDAGHRRAGCCPDPEAAPFIICQNKKFVRHVTLWARGVGMHAATSAMIRGTSLPRHLSSGAESSGSVQNPLLSGRS